jgi:hypothetical protein
MCASWFGWASRHPSQMFAEGYSDTKSTYGISRSGPVSQPRRARRVWAVLVGAGTVAGTAAAGGGAGVA